MITVIKTFFVFLICCLIKTTIKTRLIKKLISNQRENDYRDQDICRIPHLLFDQDHDQNQDVPNDANQDDNREDDRNDNTNRLFKEELIAHMTMRS